MGGGTGWPGGPSTTHLCPSLGIKSLLVQKQGGKRSIEQGAGVVQSLAGAMPLAPCHPSQSTAQSHSSPHTETGTALRSGRGEWVRRGDSRLSIEEERILQTILLPQPCLSVCRSSVLPESDGLVLNRDFWSHRTPR